MTILKGGTVAVSGLLLIGVCVLLYVEALPIMPNIPPPTPIEKAAARAAREQKIRDSDLITAFNGCEEWTKAHADPLGGKISKTYEITTIPVRLKREYWVGVDYRSQHKGQPMVGQCHYEAIIGKVILMHAAALIK